MTRATFKSTVLDRLRKTTALAMAIAAATSVAAEKVRAQAAGNEGSPPPDAATADAAPVARQAALDESFVKMLSGATLEGSFTSTGEGRDPTKLSREKYTIGQVRKIAGNLWLIPARIQYGEHDVTLPVTVPIRWAGDTPVIVVDNIPLPGFGTVSARVLFFDDHYAGYWKHGDHGGHLFGLMSRDSEPAAPTDAGAAEQEASVGDAPAGQQREE